MMNDNTKPCPNDGLNMIEVVGLEEHETDGEPLELKVYVWYCGGCNHIEKSRPFEPTLKLSFYDTDSVMKWRAAQS